MTGALLCTLFLISCLGDNESARNTRAIPAIVTIKPVDAHACYLQLDDSTTLWPLNYTSAVSKEQRALIYFQEENQKVTGYDKAVTLIRMDTILTKNIALDLGRMNNEIYGTSPIGLNAGSLWAKGGVWIEDGYLNINFITYFGGTKRHLLNLLQPDPSNPYLLELRHHAYDDPATTLQEGLVAFKLSELPETNGEIRKISLKYLSYSGERTIELHYKSKN